MIGTPAYDGDKDTGGSEGARWCEERGARGGTGWEEDIEPDQETGRQRMKVRGKESEANVESTSGSKKSEIDDGKMK